MAARLSGRSSRPKSRPYEERFRAVALPPLRPAAFFGAVLSLTFPSVQGDKRLIRTAMLASHPTS